MNRMNAFCNKNKCYTNVCTSISLLPEEQV